MEVLENLSSLALIHGATVEQKLLEQLGDSSPELRSLSNPLLPRCY